VPASQLEPDVSRLIGYTTYTVALVSAVGETPTHDQSAAAGIGDESAAPASDPDAAALIAAGKVDALIEALEGAGANGVLRRIEILGGLINEYRHAA
jgi:hypothetical protein